MKIYYDEDPPSGGGEPNEPPEPDELDVEGIKKQLDGVEGLLDKFKGQMSNVSQGYEELKELIQNRPEGSSEYDDDYISKKDLGDYLKQNNEDLMKVILDSAQQSSLMSKYKLDTEQVQEIKTYAEQTGIGNMEAALLHKLNTEGKLNLDGKSKLEVAGELIKEKKKKPGKVPGAGGGGKSADDPGDWLKGDEPDTERFMQWKEKNPEAYARWLREKSGQE